MFKNSTKLSFELNMEFGKPVRISLSIFFSLIFFLLGILLGDILSSNDTEFIIIFCVFVVIAIVYPFTFHFIYKRNLRKTMRKNPLNDGNAINHFIFDQDNFSVTSSRFENVMSNTILNYDNLLKLVENKDALYIYIGANQAFILIKDGMTEGSFEDLKDFFKSKLGNKYYIRKFIGQRRIK